MSFLSSGYLAESTALPSHSSQNSGISSCVRIDTVPTGMRDFLSSWLIPDPAMKSPEKSNSGYSKISLEWLEIVAAKISKKVATTLYIYIYGSA